MRILKKKKFLDDYNKFTIIIVWLLVALFYVFTTFLTSAIKTEFNKVYDLLKINEKEAWKLLDKYKEKKEIKTINPITNSVIVPNINNNTWNNTIEKLK
jgi:ABC-type maltose transport system permease subunit